MKASKKKSIFATPLIYLFITIFMASYDPLFVLRPRPPTLLKHPDRAEIEHKLGKKIFFMNCK